jgi:hypothetical protein
MENWHKLKVLSSSTLQLLETWSHRSNEAWSEGGVTFSFNAANRPQWFSTDDEDGIYSNTSRRPLSCGLSPEELNAFARLYLRSTSASGDEAGQDGLIWVNGLLRQLKADLGYDALALSLVDGGSDWDCTLEMATLEPRGYFVLNAFWSVD